MDGEKKLPLNVNTGLRAEAGIVEAPSETIAARMQTADEVIKTGRLDRLQLEGPGASENFESLDEGESLELIRRAKDLGICHMKECDGSLTLFNSGEELLHGLVPYGFDELGLHDDLVLALMQWTPQPLEKATHIQAEAIPKILKRLDVAIQAETGSGKTLAYLLPSADAAIRRSEGQAMERLPVVNRNLVHDARVERQRQKDWAFVRGAGTDERKGETLTDARTADDEPQMARCYCVEPSVGIGGIRAVQRPEPKAPFSQAWLRPGDEFMVADVVGTPDSVQYLQMADGRGWIPWDKQDLRLRLGLNYEEFEVGNRVEACQRLAYGSGDVVQRGTQGRIERVVPMVGVRWDNLTGIKAVDRPRQVLRKPKPPREQMNRWAKCAPDTIIITATRELVEQTADVARRLCKLLPEKAQKEWKVAVALGAPPGVGKTLKKGKEQWPFPNGEGRPRVLVSTLEFLAYFFHKRHIPLWANVRYIVFDEVDRLQEGPERRLLERVKAIILRAQYDENRKLQSVLVSSTMPSQGTKSVLKRIRLWMPHALRVLPRPDLLHRNHPMVQQQWRYMPEGFDGKVPLLVEYLKSYASEREEATEIPTKEKLGLITVEHKQMTATTHFAAMEKTMIFCNDTNTAVELAELLATTYHFDKVGLFVQKVGNDERRERMRMFRDGRIMIMVCTDILMRGIDVPDVSRVVQFDFARNIVPHMHRLGRVARAGTRGRALNLYDDSEQGGRLLAEAVQKSGDRPLDALFSRNRGFKRALQRTEKFKEMLLSQGLPLPKHLQDTEAEEGPQLLPPGATPRLEEFLEGLDAPMEEEEEESAGAPEEDEADAIFSDMVDRFESATNKEKDEEYLQILADASEEES